MWKVPEPHFDVVIVVFNRSQIVVENCGDVFLGEDVRVVADEERCFADVAVSEEDYLHADAVVLGLLKRLHYFIVYQIVLLGL